jgi:RHS repeat-associated protein
MRINELLAIADNDHATASYQYNHALQRVSKTTKTDKDNQTTNYLWHGGMIDAEIQNGQITKRYIFINLRAVAVIEYENDTNSDQNSNKNDSTSGNKYAGYKPKSTEIYAIHTDHLGTPQAITDDKQAVVWRADYATFGRATVQARVVDSSSKTAKSTNSFGIISTANAATTAAKPFEFNLRFAGQYEDAESGYHYNWHRYYDPSTGRYLTPDPIGLAGGLNGYAGQDPMGAVDPYGLKVEMNFNQTTGKLSVVDVDKFDSSKPTTIVTDPTKYDPSKGNQILVIDNVFIGANRNPEATPFAGLLKAIPAGGYDILDNKANRNHPDWYRLDRQDNMPYNDRDDTGELNYLGKPRDGFRLHKGLTSYGCVTLDKETAGTAAMWDLMVSILNGTSTDQVPNNVSINPFAPDLTRYGTLTVVK